MLKKISTRRYCHLLLSIYCLTSEFYPVSPSVIFQPDKNCPPNLSGPDCTIPFEDCEDGIRRCYNNSQCVRNNRKDSITGEYGYRCDCSFAESVSKVAGHECEYSATEICKSNSSGGASSSTESSHFCTNGGTCGTFVYRAQVHTGCHCPREYAGAHCQYLKAVGNFDFIQQGEELMDEVGVNFYAFTPKPTSRNDFITLAVSLTAFLVIVVIALSVVKGVVRSRRFANSSRSERVKLDTVQDGNSNNDSNSSNSNGIV
mmetsp:Transcript_12801/g.24024  ORF Transcript_12801/g.24024 Transcript_12801/m.24024 type:complete len:259 (+) Transcript_12801:119-895(+)